MSENKVVVTRDELLKLSANELKKICKGYGITVYRHKSQKTKAELVEEIIGYATDNSVTEIALEQENKMVESKVVKEVPEVESNEEVKVEDNKVEDNLNEPWVMGNKDNMIEKAEVGTLIAFIDEKGKPRTAKMVNRSSSRRMLKLVTEFDWEFIVPYENVLWVRNGNRWPKKVYLMLKEYKNGKPVNIVYPDEV